MHIRPARPGDEMAVAEVHVRSWQAGYRGLLPDAYLDGLRAEDRARHYTFTNEDVNTPWTQVAIDDATRGEAIVGFATTGPTRDTDKEKCGELYALYVEPTQWGRGVGAALIAATRARLIEQGFDEAILWAMEGNARADRFYRIDGWLADGLRKTESVWGVTVESLRYRRAL